MRVLPPLAFFAAIIAAPAAAQTTPTSPVTESQSDPVNPRGDRLCELASEMRQLDLAEQELRNAEQELARARARRQKISRIYSLIPGRGVDRQRRFQEQADRFADMSAMLSSFNLRANRIWLNLILVECRNR